MFVPYVKLNSKYIVDVIAKPKTIKLLGENLGKDLCDLGSSRNFSGDTKSTIYRREN